MVEFGSEVGWVDRSIIMAEESCTRSQFWWRISKPLTEGLVEPRMRLDRQDGNGSKDADSYLIGPDLNPNTGANPVHPKKAVLAFDDSLHSRDGWRCGLQPALQGHPFNWLN
jgi:hypothetical protein